MLSKISSGFNARLTQFSGSDEQACKVVGIQPHGPIPPCGQSKIITDFASAKWEIILELASAQNRPDAIDGHIIFRVIKAQAKDVAASIELPIEQWSKDVFVMLPSAAYNGNRYPCRSYSYPPMIHESSDIGPNAPIIISDVPRLNHEDGTLSQMQLLTGDLTTPCMSFYHPGANVGCILLTEQGNTLGNYGLTVEENDDRSHAILRIESPGVRRNTVYKICNNAVPSWDQGAVLNEGDEIAIRFRLFVFPADSVQNLYERFSVIRKDLSGPVVLKHELPFSAAWQIVEDKYQRENWSDEGYYRIGTHEAAQKSHFQDWQTGWVGGGMLTFALLIAGSEQSRKQAKENIDWMFRKIQYPNGLFFAVYHNGESFSDGFGRPECEKWLMVRKQVDVFYFLIKSFIALHEMEDNWVLPEEWKTGTIKLAECLLNTYKQFGQLGRYLDCESGDVVVGGSTSAAMAPGAFALAAEYFDEPEYLKAAESLAMRLYEDDVKSGVTTGGPGEILTCPDSESAFAMLESFVVLYEVTKEEKWLKCAKEMAEQSITWCASYDYVFPENSCFGKLDIRAAGSVWANVQNKHSAPGICTLSGDSLFKLFRYTGNKLFLEQIQETGHNITQYLCRKDRQVGKDDVMKPGYMCERVNFSDWECPENIGGNQFGSATWPEVALMFTTVELPGIYLQSDTGLLCVFDNIEARLVKKDSGKTVIECHNPTSFDAEVKVFIEKSGEAKNILGQVSSLQWPVFNIPAGKMVELEY